MTDRMLQMHDKILSRPPGPARGVPGTRAKRGGGDFTAPTSQKREMMHLDYEANFMTNNVLF